MKTLCSDLNSSRIALILILALFLGSAVSACSKYTKSHNWYRKWLQFYIKQR